MRPASWKEPSSKQVGAAMAIMPSAKGPEILGRDKTRGGPVTIGEEPSLPNKAWMDRLRTVDGLYQILLGVA